MRNAYQEDARATHYRKHLLEQYNLPHDSQRGETGETDHVVRLNGNGNSRSAVEWQSSKVARFIPFGGTPTRSTKLYYPISHTRKTSKALALISPPPLRV